MRSQQLPIQKLMRYFIFPFLLGNHKFLSNLAPKFVWPPEKQSDDLDPMLSGPTATPIYINPMQCSVEEHRLPAPTSAKNSSVPAPKNPPVDKSKPLFGHVNAPQYKPFVPKDEGPPVHLQPIFKQQKGSIMTFALTIAPDVPVNFKDDGSLTLRRNKNETSLKQKQKALQYGPTFDCIPQPYQHNIAFKPYQPMATLRVKAL
jgi:hypothetical protein